MKQINKYYNLFSNNKWEFQWHIHRSEWLFLDCFQVELEFGNVGFCGGRKSGVPAGSVLARRASRRPMDGHFWGKYIQNSPNLLKNLQETSHAPWTANFQFLAKSLPAGLEKSAVWLSGTSRFSCRASHFSFSFAQWARAQAGHLPTKL